MLESERLVEVRRGSRTGARVRVPGPEIVARPAGLLLELSDATIADLMVARSGIEPMAARLLAETGTDEDFDALDRTLAEVIPAGWQTGRLAEATGEFHRRVVELSGNATLRIISGMLHEITVRHTAFVIEESHPVSQGRLRQTHAVLPPAHPAGPRPRRCRRRGALAQAPRHRPSAAAAGTGGCQGPRRDGLTACRVSPDGWADRLSGQPRRMG